MAMSCLSSCSYIKPQHFSRCCVHGFVVYHLVPTSNHNGNAKRNLKAQVVYHLVPTSNHNSHHGLFDVSRVVYHLVPTSNHNYISSYISCLSVVYHLVPTSNHNREFDTSMYSELFIILFLHQTTTLNRFLCTNPLLFIILFLHQTTTSPLLLIGFCSCLSSCSYIKPQRQAIQAASNARCLSSCSYIKPQRNAAPHS